MEENAIKLHFVIASHFVNPPQILIFSVLKYSKSFFFTDEKVFSVASPDNRQNDRVYAPRDTKKRSIATEYLLRCRPMFSKSLMVSVAVSKLGCSPLFFVELGVKVDDRYYRDMLLK